MGDRVEGRRCESRQRRRAPDGALRLGCRVREQVECRARGHVLRDRVRGVGPHVADRPDIRGGVAPERRHPYDVPRGHHLLRRRHGHPHLFVQLRVAADRRVQRLGEHLRGLPTRDADARGDAVADSEGHIVANGIATSDARTADPGSDAGPHACTTDHTSAPDDASPADHDRRADDNAATDNTDPATNDRRAADARAAVVHAATHTQP
mmetsp:Transcript_16656/g.51679  ORF Transcript_16656/g.51679 Transcript_16656/m.51679 type:complete len:209 (+) Transcript_16656:2293-2919(+)